MQKRGTKRQRQGEPGNKKKIIDTDEGQSLGFPQSKEKSKESDEERNGVMERAEQLM